MQCDYGQTVAVNCCSYEAAHGVPVSVHYTCVEHAQQ
jgi:hypothetical protein